MFSSGSGGTEKRKSFFLFGSDLKASTTKSSGPRKSSVAHTKSNDHSSRKKINTTRTTNEEKQDTAKTSHRPHSSSHLSSHRIAPTHSNGQPSKLRNSVTTNIRVNSTSKQPESVKRPPPPTIDMEGIRLSTERIHSRSMSPNSSNITPQHTRERERRIPTENLLSKETMLNEHHSGNSPMQQSPHTPNVTNRRNIYQHKRERSKAEELVDDIDIYLKNYKESTSSPSPFPQNETVHEENTPNEITNISNLSVEQPIIVQIPSNDTTEEVSPLDFNSNLNSIPKLYNSSSESSTEELYHPIVNNDETSGGGSEEEEDNFSFTGSNDLKTKEQEDSVPEHISIHSDVTANSTTEEFKKKNTNPFFIQTDSDSDSGSENEPSNLRLANTGPPSPISSTTSDEYVLNYGADLRQPGDHNTENSIDLEPRRNFRIVNEDRATFYAPFDEDSDSSYSSLKKTESRNSLADTFTTPMESPNGSLIVESVNEITDSRFTSSTDIASSDYQVPSGNQSVHVNHIVSQDGLNSINDTNVIRSPTTPSSKSTRSETSVTTKTLKAEKPSRLVSSYVEELRLKYCKTSNFLEAPPNLPASLKQKNNLIQPKNIRVAIRTSSKQVGIKHGRVKQKLLTLETNTDDNKSLGSSNISSIDHTKEFHKLLGKEEALEEEDENNSEEYLNEIPGDEAYDSEDCMAPLREKRGMTNNNNGVTRSNTTVSYYTRLQNRPRSGTVDRMKSYNYKLPTNILDDYNQSQQNKNKENSTKRTVSTKSYESTALGDIYLNDGGLFVANPDRDDDA
ncbi:hypothetical protein C6P45_004257 [Maudiozyma exigua]|uniref:Uncharacterized protein n=1 Tax=Maudiozyma exigua TaxID=34358 RepID=A0A9P7BBA3_MAUEX|nr:hypothetical protein C6P45_004257 [Kazachstania exigua]